MKILFLSEDFPPQSFGGGGISAYELARSLRDLGHEVLVVTTVRKAEDAGEVELDGMRVFRICSDYHERWRAWRGLYNPPVLRELKRILQAQRPDVVHANNIHFHISWWALPLASRFAKVVWTARDVMSFNYGKLDTPRYLNRLDAHTTALDHIREARWRYNPLRNFAIRRCLRFVDHKCAVSEALKRALAQNGIRGIEVILTGLDPAVWEVSGERATAFKKAHRLEGTKPIFFGGRLSAAKGGAQAVAALGQVVAAHPDAVLLVVGKRDAYAERLEREAARLGIGERLRFVGWLSRDEMPAAYAAAEVVWVPSVCFDSLPRNVLEAMAAGKPVIGSRYGGTPEAVIDGETGYVVEVRDPARIAAPTSALLRDPALAETLGRHGRQRVGHAFNLKNMAAQYAKLYADL